MLFKVEVLRKNRDSITLNATCNWCAREHEQEWVVKNDRCKWCREILSLKEENQKLKTKVKDLEMRIQCEQEVNLAALEKAEEWNKIHFNERMEKMLEKLVGSEEANRIMIMKKEQEKEELTRKQEAEAFTSLEQQSEWAGINKQESFHEKIVSWFFAPCLTWSSPFKL